MEDLSTEASAAVIDSLDFNDIFSFGDAASPGAASGTKPRDNHHVTPPPRTETTPTKEDAETADDPPDVAEIQAMREKLASMGIVEVSTAGKEIVASNSELSQRERELTDMVLRLTHPSLYPLPTQLVDQANTISQLTKQLDLVLRRSDDERQFFEAEKDSWVRVAGALTARRFVDGTQRADVLERDNLNLLSDNKMLKVKLQDQQNRVESLEAELRMLRPLLLLRPHSPPRPGTANLASVSRPAGRPRKFKDRDSARFSDEELDLHHNKKGHNPLKYSTIADARSEHLLLATRKLGKQKVAAMLPASAFPPPPTPNAVGTLGPLPVLPPVSANGATPVSLPPPMSPQRSQQTAPTPTPSGSRTHLTRATGSSATPSGPPTFATRGAVGTPRTPRYATQSSPTRTRSQVNQPSTPSQRGPAVPSSAGSQISALDHLITASRMLDTNGLDQTPTRGSPGSSSIDGSPIKRRRMEESPTRAQAEDSTAGPSSAANAGRMMSALDVLAEQAAVVISQSPRKGKESRSLSRGSDIESEDEIYIPPPNPKGKGRNDRHELTTSRGSKDSTNLKSPIAIRPSPGASVPEMDLDEQRTPTRSRPRRTAAGL